MYEESLRMPLLARYPREVAAGSVSEAMVLNVDFALTICDLAGVSPTSPMQGRSLRPLLRGEAPDDWRQEMYYRYWMHLDGSHGVWAHCGVRTHRYKLVQYYGEALGQPGTTDEPRPEEWELFDLEHDPLELRSVHEDPEYAEVRRDLTARLARLQRELGDAPTVELPIPLPKLAAPRGLLARPGRGQVTLDWEPVEGAAGYIIERSSKADGGWEMLVIGEPEVRPVPHPPFTDTSGQVGREVRYRVAAAASVKDFEQPRSEAVAAAPALDGSAHVAIAIRADQPIGPVHRPWRPMIGSEHLSQLEERGTTGGRPIGAEFAEALRLAHEELGVEAVRAHAILGDDLGTYREVDGEPVLDFSGISRNYDRVLDLGLRPIVELGFMPRDLAVDPSKTVSSIGPSSALPGTGTDGASSFGSWRRTSWSATVVTRSGAGPSRSGTRPTSAPSGRGPARSTCASTT